MLISLNDASFACVQVAETYAFLPREAVTKFLMSCADCQKRMHLTMDNYGTVQARLPVTVSCAISASRLNAGQSVFKF